MTFRSAAVLVFALALAGAARAQTPDLHGLHDALHLTHAQEAGWRAYQAAITPDPRSQARRGAAMAMMASLPSPRRVDLINAEMDAEAAEVHRQGEAVNAFYATLTPDQQRIFDRRTLPSGDGSHASSQP